MGPVFPHLALLLALGSGPSAYAANDSAPVPATLQAPAFAASALLDVEDLSPGETYAVRLMLEVSGEIQPLFQWEDPRKAGELRRPILQIEAPDCVRLLGEAPTQLTTPGDLQESYLRMPFGRRLLEKNTDIEFELASKPQDGDTLGLNIVTYLESDEEPEQARFVRLRIDLPLKSGAQARGLPASSSRWAEATTLALGDKAPAFDLQDARDGKKVSLQDVLQKKRALVMAYRRST